MKLKYYERVWICNKNISALKNFILNMFKYISFSSFFRTWKTFATKMGILKLPGRSSRSTFPRHFNTLIITRYVYQEYVAVFIVLNIAVSCVGSDFLAEWAPQNPLEYHVKELYFFARRGDRLFVTSHCKFLRVSPSSKMKKILVPLFQCGRPSTPPHK